MPEAGDSSSGGPAWRGDAALFDAIAAAGRRTRLPLEDYERIYRQMGLLDWLEAQAPEAPVVEIGCCDGLHLLNLAALAGRPGLGADVSIASLLAGRAEARERGLPVRFVAADALRMALADASCATVLFFGTLHHFFSRGLTEALAEARRLLAPEGRLFVADLSLLYPYHVLAFGGARVLGRLGVRSVAETFTPGEMALWPGRLERAARRAGLEPVAGSLGWFSYVEPLSRTAPAPSPLVFRAAWAACRAIGRVLPRACRCDSFHLAFHRREAA